MSDTSKGRSHATHVETDEIDSNEFEQNEMDQLTAGKVEIRVSGGCSGPFFPFRFGDQSSSFHCWWRLYERSSAASPSSRILADMIVETARDAR